MKHIQTFNGLNKVTTLIIHIPAYKVCNNNNNNNFRLVYIKYLLLLLVVEGLA